jgi:hypothetical protein
MTAVNVRPHWPATEDWTGFLLVIVTAGPLGVPGEALRRMVGDRIDADPVLYDLVTVTVAPPFEATGEWSRGLLTTVVEAAMPDGHFFAPRGAVAFVVVSGREDAIGEVFAHLNTVPVLGKLNARLYGVAVEADERTGVSADSVLRIANLATVLIEKYDDDPRIALAERAFLGWVDTLVTDHQLVLPAGAPAAPAIQPAPAPPELPDPPASVFVPAPRSVEVGPAEPSVEPARPKREVPPVVYDGADIVTVDPRTAMQKLTRQQESDVDALGLLERDGRAVAPVFLIFVPDDGVVAPQEAKRRTAIALDLDQAFTSVDFDVLRDLPAHVAIEVFSSTNPVQKHGVLRLAGDLTESALPKMEIEYFSLAEATTPLLEAARRTERALLARGVEVVSKHFVFLAAMSFPADDGAVAQWTDLLRDGRVTWIDFSASGPRERLTGMPASPYGLHVLTDKEDVVSVIKQESEVIYGYAATLDLTPEVAPAGDEAPDVAPAKRRRWWRRGEQG